MANTPHAKLSAALIVAALVVATLGVYFPVTTHDFINFDDDIYVYKNPFIRNGISVNSLLWAAKTTYPYYWHPVTWLSHMLDVQWFGLHAGHHHGINLLLHVANVVLVFVIFRRMTGSLWRTAVLAAVLALHPLRVEPVAWIAERKDLLCMFFWLLTMGAYAHYARQPGWRRYLPVLVLFIAALMSKPMAVTLPFSLLLLDFWPLKRFNPWSRHNRGELARRLLREKIPLFILSALSVAGTLLALDLGNYIKPGSEFSWDVRLANAVVSYVRYMAKFAWPTDLAILYPHSGAPAPWSLTLALALLILVTIVSVKTASRHPYGLTGWLWYLGTLVPALGIVQAGEQAMADRFTYLPLIGLTLMVVWPAADYLARLRNGKIIAGIISVVLLTLMGLGSRNQLAHWESSLSVYRHALAVTEGNHTAHNNLGVALMESGDFPAAEKHLRSALDLKAGYSEAHNNLGTLLARKDRGAEALDHYLRAVALDPENANARINLGIALAAKNDTPGAAEHLIKAVQLNPNSTKAHNNLGILLVKSNRRPEALHHFRRAVSLDPGYTEAWGNLGNLLLSTGRMQEAIDCFSEVLRRNPGAPGTHRKVGLALAKLGRHKEAIRAYRQALSNQPDQARTHFYLALSLLAEGDRPAARRHLEETLRLQPDHPTARRILEKVKR